MCLIRVNICGDLKRNDACSPRLSAGVAFPNGRLVATVLRHMSLRSWSDLPLENENLLKTYDLAAVVALAGARAVAPHMSDTPALHAVDVMR